jgi:hypothetical protein
MNPTLQLAPRAFPARIADLGFTAQLPADWISHELPQEEVDFSNPTQLVPLAIVTAPHAAIVFAFAARPAYDDGTLHDWAWYLLQLNQLKPRAIGGHTLGPLPAIVGEALQDSDLGPMLVRFAFLEDGGRLVNISFTAPESLAEAVRDAWFALLDSFTLSTPRGSRFASTAAAGAEPQPPPAAPAAETPPAPPPVKPAAAKPARVNFATFALADTDASLNEDHPLNADLRDRGVGLMPNTVATDDQAKAAIVAAGSIRAQFRVPFGWHVIDDGKRALVFDPNNEIQIHLHLLSREGRNNQAVLDALEAEARSSYPQPEFMRMQEGSIEMLGVRGIADGSQPLEQYHMLWPARQKDVVLRARVTTVPPRSTDALNLAELILKSMDFGCFPEPEAPPSEANQPRTEKARRKAMVHARQSAAAQPLPPQHDASMVTAAAGHAPNTRNIVPDWRERVRALEADGQLEAAQKMIEDNVPHLGCAASVAEMYRRQMNRLKEAGDEAGALAAFRKADDFIWSYASAATSGGEGAALSYDRDRFRAQLVREFGYDPAEEK